MLYYAFSYSCGFTLMSQRHLDMMMISSENQMTVYYFGLLIDHFSVFHKFLWAFNTFLFSADVDYQSTFSPFPNWKTASAAGF